MGSGAAEAVDLGAMGVGLTGTPFSWFVGPRDRQRTGVPSYSGVKYDDLWPGISARWNGKARDLESTFTVAPGADPNQKPTSAACSCRSRRGHSRGQLLRSGSAHPRQAGRAAALRSAVAGLRQVAASVSGSRRCGNCGPCHSPSSGYPNTKPLNRHGPRPFGEVGGGQTANFAALKGTDQ